MKVLVLCHGRNHVLHQELTPLILTPTMTKNMTFLDKDPSCKPDILCDWKEKTYLGETFDIVTSIGCDSDLFITQEGELVDNCFKNVINSLKIGGKFIMEPLTIANIKIIATKWAGAGPLFEYIAKNPFDIDTYPEIEKILNEYVASSVEIAYPRLKWAKNIKLRCGYLFCKTT